MKFHQIFLSVLLTISAYGQSQPPSSPPSELNGNSGAQNQSGVAPGTILYVIKRFNIRTTDGLQGMAVGTKVTLVREDLGDYVVTDGTIEGKAPKEMFTTDLSTANSESKAESTKQAVASHNQVISQARASRYTRFTEEIQKKKEDLLYAPTRMFQTGSKKEEVDAFEKESKDTIDYLEKRLHTLQTLIAAMDSQDVPLEDTQHLIEAVSSRKVFIGMPKAFVLLSWGIPSDINRTIHESVDSEQWVYRRGQYSSDYVYIRDGKVESLQD